MGRVDYENMDRIICPYCDTESDEDFSYDEEEKELECEECGKMFLVKSDDDSFTTKKMPCKKGHHWKLRESFYKSNYQNVDEKGYESNVYVCSECDEWDFRPINPDTGKEYSRKHIKYMWKQKRKPDTGKKHSGVKSFKVEVRDDSFCINTDEAKGNRDLFKDILRLLKKIGWKVGYDPEVQKEYPSLNSTYRYAIWKGLECKLEYYPAGMKIEFYQNIVPGKRKDGKGEYEFNKIQYMPYLILLRLKYTCHKLREQLESQKRYSVSEKVISKLDWHGSLNLDYYKTDKEKVSRIKTTDKQPEESYNNQDRDKKKILNGQIKYFRDRQGTLKRGIAYHNINNMWWMIINHETYTNIASFDLFDVTIEDLEKRRLAKHRSPKSYTVRKESLGKASSKELLNELKRRGKKSI